MEIIQWLVGWLNYLFPIAILIFLVYYIIGPRKRHMKKYYEALEAGTAYGKETVELLREIRDLLRR